MLSLVSCGGDFSKGDKLILLADYADQRIGYMEVTVQDVEDSIVVKVGEMHEERIPGYKLGDLISVSKDELYPLSEGLEIVKKRKQFYNELHHNNTNLDIDKMKGMAKAAKLSEMGSYLTALASVKETKLMWKKIAGSAPKTFVCDFSNIDSAAIGKQLDRMSVAVQQYLSEVKSMPYAKGTALVGGDSYGYKTLPLARNLIANTFTVNDGMKLAYVESRVCEGNPVGGNLLADKILAVGHDIEASEKGLARNGELKSELKKVVLDYRARGIYRLIKKNIAAIDAAINVVSQDPKKADSLFTYDPAYKKNIEKKMAFYGISRMSFDIEDGIAVYLKKVAEYQQAKVDYAEKKLKSMVVEGKSLEEVKNATNLLGKDLSLDDRQIQGIEGKISSWFKQKAKLAARRAKIEKITKELKAHKWVAATYIGSQIIHIDFNAREYKNERILKKGNEGGFSKMDFHFEYDVSPEGNIVLKKNGKKWKTLKYKNHAITLDLRARYTYGGIVFVSEEKYKHELKKVDEVFGSYHINGIDKFTIKLDKRNSFSSYVKSDTSNATLAPVFYLGRWVTSYFFPTQTYSSWFDRSKNYLILNGREFPKFK